MLLFTSSAVRTMLIFPLTAHKYSQAIDLYTQAIELHSENAVNWANRTIAHARLEECGSAIQDMAVQYRMHQGLLKLIPNIRRHALQSETFVGHSGKSAAIYACAKEQDFLVIEVHDSLRLSFSMKVPSPCKESCKLNIYLLLCGLQRLGL
ncbi:Serine/threonine-protein phosphatase 5 [Camellia lanceoleosa]|uniref:Serine/threonine-protein phosphatase 5 n=1 Tax=Camellia lanceoleosa TaxID=1840588 RepID=A0ACC0H9R0_9ERIC|nr:Serine/threonine-protein phosphatase 5 [Camellia lanceoleosa]